METESAEFLLTEQKYQEIRNSYQKLLLESMETSRREDLTIQEIVSKALSFRGSSEMQLKLGITEAEFKEFCWRRDEEVLAEIHAS